MRPMSFKDAIAVINDRAHVASEYPVIVTLENHASRETRAVMAKIMRHTFGDKLWTPPSKGEGEEESFVLDRWPSPAELKGKVIIRDKVKHKQDDVKNASFGVGKVFEAISSRGKSSREASYRRAPKLHFQLGKTSSRWRTPWSTSPKVRLQAFLKTPMRRARTTAARTTRTSRHSSHCEI